MVFCRALSYYRVSLCHYTLMIILKQTLRANHTRIIIFCNTLLFFFSKSNLPIRNWTIQGGKLQNTWPLTYHYFGLGKNVTVSFIPSKFQFLHRLLDTTFQAFISYSPITQNFHFILHRALSVCTLLKILTGNLISFLLLDQIPRGWAFWTISASFFLPCMEFVSYNM